MYLYSTYKEFQNNFYLKLPLLYGKYHIVKIELKNSYSRQN